MSQSRRLAAILAADVVGYSGMVGRDEPGTLARVRALRTDLIEPLATSHGGRLFKTTGDGFLAAFTSSVEALRCANAIQERLSAQPDGLRLRIGVHQGEVVAEGDDLVGDGVIVAARLEPLAEPGGVCISARVREDAAGKMALDVEDIGTPELKNIEQKVHVYRVRVGATPKEALPLPDKPSLVVLPFQNMSGDPEQEYFVDGLVEDITTALSCIRSLFVIARNSAFTYKGRALDVRQVGRELGVRYVLEGSVRKAGSRLRITGQLVDAATGAHLWADRFDGALDDVFDLQDRVTANVAGVIEPHLQHAEIERAHRKPTQDLGAYDYFLRGMAIFHEYKAETAPEARALFAKAWKLDPRYGAAYGAAARTFTSEKIAGKLPAGGAEEAEAVRLARLAAETGPDDSSALSNAGAALAYVGGQPEAAALLIERACSLNPNAAQAWNNAGLVKVYLGDPDGALADIARAARLSPVDPLRFAVYLNRAQAYFFAGRYFEAVAWAERAVSEQPRHLVSLRYLAAGLAMAGRLDEARRVMAEHVPLAPQVRISNASNWMARFNKTEYAARLLGSLRLAGMPE